jgi:branched-chain amino acid transport system substrate-binding protein
MWSSTTRATRPSGARNARRFATEDKVDVIIGSSTVPVALAQGGVANEARIPFIALCPIPIDPAKQSYLFAVPQPIPLMVSALVEHMQAARVKTVGYIGFSDSWGRPELQPHEERRHGRRHGDHHQRALRPQRHLRHRADAQGAGHQSGRDLRRRLGHPAALPQLVAQERGYRKQIYHTHGVVNPDFIRLGGKSVEGVIAPTGRSSSRSSCPPAIR